MEHIKQMKLAKLLLLFIVTWFATASNLALASVVYSYDGKKFNSFSSPTSYDISNFITGTVTLANLLPANTTYEPAIMDFSFFDGVQTIDQDDPVDVLFRFTTDISGAITDWKVTLKTPVPAMPLSGFIEYSIITVNEGTHFEDTGSISTATYPVPGVLVWERDFGTILDLPGLWTTSEVPIPATAWLFGSGLLGLFGVARRKKQFAG